MLSKSRFASRRYQASLCYDTPNLPNPRRASCRKCSRCSRRTATRWSANPPSSIKEAANDRAHQSGSNPIDIPEVVRNPAVVPKPEPAPSGPAPEEPVKVPVNVPADRFTRKVEPQSRARHVSSNRTH